MSQKSLQEQLEEVETELRNEHQRGALMDSGKVEELAVRRQELNAQISAQADAQQHEERMEEAQERINTAFDEVEFDGEKYPIRVFTKDEGSAQVLRIHFTNIHLTQEDENGKRVLELKAGYEADKNQLKEELKEAKEMVQSLKEQLAQAIMDKEDLEQKRDAAVRMAEDAVRAKDAAELLADEKQKHIDKLREEQAIGASAAVRIVTNVEGDMAEAMKAWKEQRPAIYDVQPTDPLKKVEFRAKLAETDEEITDKYIYIGKYRQLDEAEAGRFRLEREAAKAAAEVVEPDTHVEANISLVVPPVFPFQEEPTTGLDEHSTVSESDAPVTRQEFNQLTARVAQLEQSKVAVA